MTPLTVKDLRVCLESREETVRAMDGVYYFLEEGESLGLVREDDCGNTRHL